MKLSNYKLPAIYVGAALNGALYFFVAESGGPHIPLLQDSPTAIHVFSAWAALDYALIMKNIYQQLDIKPKTYFAGLLSTLGVFAAMTLFTAGYFGALRMQLSIELAAAIGLLMHALRSLNMFDAANRMPEKFQELKTNWLNALKSLNYAELIRIAVTLFATIGYAACTTDSVDAATYQIGTLLGQWLNFSPNLTALSAVSYSFSPLGAIGIFAMVLYWTHRGIKQLSYGGKINENGSNIDITDRYTLAAFMMGIPMFLSALGAATSPNGRVFGQLGEFTKIIRIICSFIYGVASVIAPLSGTLRELGNHYCKQKPTAESALLLATDGITLRTRSINSASSLNNYGATALS